MNRMNYSKISKRIFQHKPPFDYNRHTLILFIDLQYSNNQSPPTLSWCCFIPDSNENDDNDAYTIMSVTRGSNVCLFFLF